jgi:hypothetical protein
MNPTPTDPTAGGGDPPAAAAPVPAAPKSGGGADTKKKKGNGSPLDITSVGMLVTALIGLLGALTLSGTVGRVQRNHPKGFTIAICLVVVAAAAWILANQWEKRAGLLRGAALGLAVIGYGIAIAITIATANDEPRPHITTKLSRNRSVLHATVKASDLPVKDRLKVQVDLLQRKPNPGSGDPLFSTSPQSIYRAYIGPDADGNVKQSFATPLPRRGPFTDVGIKAFTGSASPGCDDLVVLPNQRQTTGYRGSGTGCVIIALHPARLAP